MCSSCGKFNLLAIIAIPLGWLMWLCHMALPVYALALLLFTVITRIILFPLSLKQHKSMAKMQALKPRQDALQRQYGNDQEKLQQEQMKLYESIGYNPLSGCLPLILQMVFLFGLINVIYNPLTHILQLPSATVDALQERGAAVAELLDDDTSKTRVESYDMYVITLISKADKAVKDGTLSSNPFYDYDEVITEEVMETINKFDMNLFGFFLGDTIEVPWPTTTKTVITDDSGEAVLDADGNKTYDVVKKGWTFHWTLLLPLLSGITSFLSTIITKLINPASAEAEQNASMKAMFYIMPLFSVWIGFSVPAGVCLYWVYSNVAMLLQTVIQYRFWNPQKLAEQAEAELAEMEEKNRKRKPTVIRTERVTASGETVTEEKTVTQHEADRIRLAEARRRDAEKYGDEYVDVTEEDFK